MRIVFLTESFSKNMGYLGNILPRYLSELGADVHMVTTDLPSYYYIDNFAKTYGSFDASAVSPVGTVEDGGGFTLHTLGHERRLGYTRIKGLSAKLKELRPDIVQVHAAIGWLPLEAAALQPILGYKYFIGSHTTASVFPLAQRESHFWEPERIRCLLTRTIPGRLVSHFAEKCYAPTEDCGFVAQRFFGVPAHLISQIPLGVDTEVFHMDASAEALSRRASRRTELAVEDSELLCIYTGRFTDEKNPLVLARAVGELRRDGLSFRAVFVGDGVQGDALTKCDGCIVRPFVPYQELVDWFNAADIGVWPTQESTSMLDAAACGLPIIVNDTLVARERIDGNGLTYRLNDSRDLARVLRTLMSAEERHRLGSTGARRMAEEFGWAALARRRMDDYERTMQST
jgi:glycosyltransferase involved in cell wall biosynthesis